MSGYIAAVIVCGQNRCGGKVLTSCCDKFTLGRVCELFYGDVDGGDEVGGDKVVGSDEVRELWGSCQRFTTIFGLRLMTRPVLSVRGCAGSVENTGTASVGEPTHRRTDTEANTRMQSHRLRHKLRHKRIQAHPFQSRQKNRRWRQAPRNIGTRSPTFSIVAVSHTLLLGPLRLRKTARPRVALQLTTIIEIATSRACPIPWLSRHGPAVRPPANQL
jgi:hypothetical protein